MASNRISTSFDSWSGVEPPFEFFHQQIVFDHVLRFAEEGHNIEIERGCREYQMDDRRYDSRMRPASDNHRRHREQHRPQCRWEHVGFEYFRSLDEVLFDRMAQYQVFHLFAGPDEVEHRHTLRQSYQERREKTEENMLRNIGGRKKAKVHGNEKTNDR